FRIDPGQIQQSPDLSNEMIVRNHLIEPELIKQLPLVLTASPHHRPPPRQSRPRTESRSHSVFNRLLQHYLPEAEVWRGDNISERRPWRDGRQAPIGGEVPVGSFHGSRV